MLKVMMAIFPCVIKVICSSREAISLRIEAVMREKLFL